VSLDLPIRPLPFERRDELRLGSAFAFSWDEGYLEDGPDEGFDALYEADRTRCAFDGDEVVGTLGVFSVEMTVPGRPAVPTAGTTAISVRPTHRRRGLLRRMMAAHFEEIRERGEPLSALWASESSIYRRFGYGEAASMSSEKIDRRDTAFREDVLPAEGRCRMIDKQEALALLPGAYALAQRRRPGMLARSADWWQHRVLRDAAWSRHGGTPLRRVVYEKDGEPRGYLLYRTREAGPKLHGLIIELIGADPDAEAALYQVACNIDLLDDLRFWNQPVDSPLSLLLADPRCLERQVRDALWVRLMQTPAALEARSYSAEGRLQLRVRDGFAPENEGDYTLDASGGGATCKRAAWDSPDIDLDVADLAAAYLGGIRFQSLARAGRATGSPAALRLADALFASDLTPYNPEIF
jgi:predicted acetyltransferase